MVSARTRVWTRAAGIFAAVALATTVAAQQAPGQLPGGAQSVSEAYQDWQMMCGQPQGVKQCAIAQQVTDGKTGQRIVGIEVKPQGDKAEGMLLMPFGLTLDKGVALRIGESEIASGLRFKTCVLPGCLVPLTLDAKTVAALRKAPTLVVNAVGDNDQVVPLSISLNGFGPALDRAIALAK